MWQWVSYSSSRKYFTEYFEKVLDSWICSGILSRGESGSFQSTRLSIMWFWYFWLHTLITSKLFLHQGNSLRRKPNQTMEIRLALWNRKSMRELWPLYLLRIDFSASKPTDWTLHFCNSFVSLVSLRIFPNRDSFVPRRKQPAIYSISQHSNEVGHIYSTQSWAYGRKSVKTLMLVHFLVLNSLTMYPCMRIRRAFTSKHHRRAVRTVLLPEVAGLSGFDLRDGFMLL